MPQNNDETKPTKATGLSGRERQLAGLRPAKKGEVRNPTGMNGHRRRQELIASILDEPEDSPTCSTPGESRIRNVILALVSEAYSGGIGGVGAGKALVEQYAGRPRQQVDLSSSDGTMSPTRKPTTAEARQELDRILAAIEGRPEASQDTGEG